VLNRHQSESFSTSLDGNLWQPPIGTDEILVPFATHESVACVTKARRQVNPVGSTLARTEPRREIGA
jgi:hypothetical protein